LLLNVVHDPTHRLVKNVKITKHTRRRARLSPCVVALAALAAGCHGRAAPAPGPASTHPSAKEAVVVDAVVNEKLETTFAAWEREGATGDEDHRQRLRQLASVVRTRLDASHGVDLVFVCTHNSRRSHMAQLLAAAAAKRKGLSNVRTFSGGTETTAFNPRAVAALQRVGFDIQKVSGGTNPRYAVRFGPAAPPVEAFSKRFTEPPNPSRDFVAVMTCSQADAACPLVPGAAARLAVPYEDPKVADDTPEEAARYDERVAQIGRDLAWVFSVVATAPSTP